MIRNNIRKQVQSQDDSRSVNETVANAITRLDEHNSSNMTETLSIRPCIEWLWKSIDTDEWYSCSNVESMIIEKAFQKKLEKAFIDDYYIDFKRFVQISNNNFEEQRPIKRTVNERMQSGVRQERFTENPINPSACFTKRSFSDREPFYNAFYEHFNFSDSVSPLNNTASFRLIVEKAASGLNIEGTNVGKKRKVSGWRKSYSWL